MNASAAIVDSHVPDTEANYGALLSRQVNSMALNLASAGATHLDAGRMASGQAGSPLGFGKGRILVRRGRWVRSRTYCFKYAFLPHGSARKTPPPHRLGRRPQAWRSLFFAPWTSPRDCAISQRTVMNNAGLDATLVRPVTVKKEKICGISY